MLKAWKEPYNVVLKCLRGLEHNLFNELQSFGIERDSLLKSRSRITVLNCNLRRLYFLSYFSRLASNVYMEVGKFPISEKKSLFEACQKIKWSDFIDNSKTYSLSCSQLVENSHINSKKYACQLIKDGINNHFSENMKVDPPKLALTRPQIKMEVEVDEKCEATLLVDAVGSPLSRRGYRYKPNIGDIDPTAVCSILYDIGYSRFEESPFSVHEYERMCNSSEDPNSAEKLKNLSNCEDSSSSSNGITSPSMVDLFSGCGIFLIESALLSARVPPGYFKSHFSFQKFPVFDDSAFQMLRKYSETKMVTPDSEKRKSLRGKFVGIERDWEKLEASLQSSERAGILDLISFNQAEYLKDGLRDARNTGNSEEWKYMIAQVPQMKKRPATSEGEGREETQSSEDSPKDRMGKCNLSSDRYLTLLKSLSRVRDNYFPRGSKGVLILPSFIDKSKVKESFSNTLKVGKTFNKDGISNTTYYTV